jgi:co-chaperonin GroES (HSP10)
MSNWTPHQHRILVEIDEVEQVSKGGIILSDTTRQQEQNAQVLATIIAVGATAVVDQELIRAGTRVMIAKWGGAPIPNKPRLRVINDEDINAVLQEADV